ncbi:MAG: T9SS type A sorting domain-containing protein, partial [Bacteroidetes bacterium]|nr:T9SS type A sorting domain-containing protein [Bacteroidota bacterium]
SITFKLQSGAIGQKVTAAVYFTDGNKLPAAEVPLSTTDTLVISSTAQTWYTLPIAGSPLYLPPGNYLVGVKEVNGSTPIGMTFSTTDFVPNSSYIFAEGFGWTKSEDFWVGEFIYLIRANFGVSSPLLSTSICSVDASCSSCCDGEATVMASGGVLPYSYQWNDSLLQITPTATGLCPGDYMVIVTDSIGNVDTAYVTINGPVGINGSITDNGIKLYPDPTPGMINIEFSAEEIKVASISVYNIIGTKVYEITPGSNAKKNHYTIELSNQPDGAYFVQIQTADRVITKKIILNK